MEETASTRYRTWNSALQDAIVQFSTDHPDLTVMTFSSWDTFNRILDNPTAYGFPEYDKRRSGGTIWLDHLHPTSRIHDLLAHDLAKFLNAQAAFSHTPGSSELAGVTSQT
jgi:phospholipase/lecithinase/hemolysin